MARSTISELSDGDLFEKLGESRQELFNLRFQHVTGQTENTARIKQMRKEVARVLTELHAREIVAAEALEDGE